MIDVSNYIVENISTLFGPSYDPPIKIDIVQKRFTSVVYFCKIYFDNRVIKKIVIKHYDDGHSSRLSSLKNEYGFSTKHYESFNSEDIGIPKYIHFDPQKELVVFDYIENSRTLEKTLLASHKGFNSRTLDNIFYNSGMWLARFHSINAKPTNYEISPFNLISEIKDKWVQEFDNQNEIQNDLKYQIYNAVSEGRSCGLSLLHKEYAPGNILHVGNRVYGIDFGTPERGCVLDDVAYFIISTLVLNNFPKHPFYKKIRYDSNEIRNFCAGYLSCSDINENIFDTHLFHFFLYKNLIRRISTHLRKSDRYSKYVNFAIKPVIYNIFHRAKKDII